MIKRQISKCAINNSEGYIFVAALLAVFLMTAIGILIFSLTSRDLITTVRLIGEKRAQNAAETGVQRLMEQISTNIGDVSGVTTSRQTITVTSGSRTFTDYYTVTSTALPSNVFTAAHSSGYEVGGTGTAKSWSSTITGYTVVGESGDFGGRFEVEVGVGYGPVELSTSQPGAGG